MCPVDVGYMDGEKEFLEGRDVANWDSAAPSFDPIIVHPISQCRCGMVNIEEGGHK